MRHLLLLPIFAALTPQTHAAQPMRSVTILSSGVSCIGDDNYLNLALRNPGAGIFPTGPSVIIGYQMWSNLPGATDYVVIGKTQPYGDWITAVIYGPSGNTDPVFYPTGFPFDPSTGQLHQHYLCGVRETAGGFFGVTIFYTLDSDPPL